MPIGKALATTTDMIEAKSPPALGIIPSAIVEQLVDGSDRWRGDHPPHGLRAERLSAPKLRVDELAVAHSLEPTAPVGRLVAGTFGQDGDSSSEVLTPADSERETIDVDGALSRMDKRSPSPLLIAHPK
jgi:hypothetical protein